MFAAGCPPGTTEAAVQVAVSATFVAVSTPTMLPAVAAATGAPEPAAAAPPCASDWEIWTRLAVPSAGVICGRTMNEFMTFEIDWIGPAIAAGIARQAGMKPIRTVGHPGPGPIGVPWLGVLVTFAAGGIGYRAFPPLVRAAGPLMGTT